METLIKTIRCLHHSDSESQRLARSKQHCCHKTGNVGRTVSGVAFIDVAAENDPKQMTAVSQFCCCGPVSPRSSTPSLSRRDNSSASLVSDLQVGASVTTGGSLDSPHFSETPLLRHKLEACSKPRFRAQAAESHLKFVKDQTCVHGLLWTSRLYQKRTHFWLIDLNVLDFVLLIGCYFSVSDVSHWG